MKFSKTGIFLTMWSVMSIGVYGWIFTAHPHFSSLISPETETVQTTPITTPVTTPTSTTQTAKTTPRPGCTNTTLPYKTVYKTNSVLPVGQTQTIPGVAGIKTECPAHPEFNVTFQPLDAIVYTGTYVAPIYTAAAPIPGPSVAEKAALAAQRGERINSCLAIIRSHGGGGGSAEQQCYSIQ